MEDWRCVRWRPGDEAGDFRASDTTVSVANKSLKSRVDMTLRSCPHALYLLLRTVKYLLVLVSADVPEPLTGEITLAPHSYPRDLHISVQQRTYRV